MSLILYIFISDIFLTLPVLSIGISLIPLLIFAISGLSFIIMGLWRLRTAFIVLGAEGIVYKLKTGIIKGFKWEEISDDTTADYVRPVGNGVTYQFKSGNQTESSSYSYMLIENTLKEYIKIKWFRRSFG